MIAFIQDAAKTASALPDNTKGLTTAGWIFISIVWTIIISLLIFCYHKIFQKAAEKKQQAKFQAMSPDKELTS